MISASRTHAERHFTATEKRQKKALSGQEEAARVVNEKTNRLKALRLAKEAKDQAEELANPTVTKKKRTVVRAT